MTWESEFEEFMTQTVTIAPRSSVDKYGEETYGSSVSVKCRIVLEPKMVRTDDGREVVSSGHLYTAGPTGVTPKHRLTLPDGSTPVILYVGNYPDESGEHHEQVYF